MAHTPRQKRGESRLSVKKALQDHSFVFFFFLSVCMFIDVNAFLNYFYF